MRTCGRHQCRRKVRTPYLTTLECANVLYSSELYFVCWMLFCCATVLRGRLRAVRAAVRPPARLRAAPVRGAVPRGRLLPLQRERRARVRLRAHAGRAALRQTQRRTEAPQVLISMSVSVPSAYTACRFY